MKEKKEITISFYVEDDKIKDIKFTGERVALTAALSKHPAFHDCVVSAMTNLYITSENREEFLVYFLCMASKKDERLRSFMKEKKMK